MSKITKRQDMMARLNNAFPQLKRASQSEQTMALAFCLKYNLNPLLKEVYLVNMNGKLAPITNYLVLVNRVKAKKPNITEKWEYLKDENWNLIACELVLLDNGKEVVRQIVHLKEYAAKTPIWREKPNTMLQKVARAQAYRLIDEEFVGLYIQEELKDNETIAPNVAETEAEVKERVKKTNLSTLILDNMPVNSQNIDNNEQKQDLSNNSPEIEASALNDWRGD